MLNKPVGRNDPCPCGSGKKYKRCCLPRDEQAAARERLAVAQPEPDASPALQAPDIHQIPALMQELARKSSSREERAEFEKLLAQAKAMLDYVEKEPAIEAAAKAIEPYRAEFLKRTKDAEAYQERTHALFAEERFVPLRFTGEAVRRAFDKAGQPMPGMADKEFIEVARKAILDLADKDWRDRSAMTLWSSLPDYAASQRPLDAYVIQDCAYATQEETDESNAFIYEMFAYGYDAWAAEQRQRDAAALGELGLDVSRLEQMSMEEVDAWLQDQQSDSAKLARMEKLLLADPRKRAQAEAHVDRLERTANRLLERPDAAHLLLSPDEVGPWVPGVAETYTSVCARFRDFGGASSSDAASKAFLEAVMPLLSKMLAEVFTAERLRQLAAELKAYRNQRFDAGDKETAELANAAMMSVERETEPGLNHFLCALGYLSLINGWQVSVGEEQPSMPDREEPPG